MNRFRKEEARKRQEAREGLSELEIKQLENEESKEREILDLTRSIHAERFPEEYDHMYDSIADASDRDSGKNPMSQEYIAKVAAKRKALGVSPLSESGMLTSDDTWKIARAAAEARLEGKSK